MEKAQLQELQPHMVSLAIKAGARILDFYRHGYDVEHKSDQTPLTQADIAAHEIIEEGLQALTPDIPVLSEEGEMVPFEIRKQWELYWLVDPLDGTQEFIRRNDEFTVNIALIKHGKPIMGLIHAPELEECYFASRGLGAYKKPTNKKPRLIRVKPHCRKSVVIAGSNSHPSEAFKQFVANVGDHIMLSMGSSLKSCMVAEGTADIYARLGPTSEWDTAAAQCIVEEAGGKLTDTNMQPLSYNTKDSLLNPHFFVFGDCSIDWSSYLA